MSIDFLIEVLHSRMKEVMSRIYRTNDFFSRIILYLDESDVRFKSDMLEAIESRRLKYKNEYDSMHADLLGLQWEFHTRS
jgi:hypothetical protein